MSEATTPPKSEATPLSRREAAPPSRPRGWLSGLAARVLRPPMRSGLASMPERVRGEIRRREAEAERLIGWIQLALVLFFVALYSLAPRAEGATGFNFVPLALAAYLLFTLVRLVLSYRYELPAWYLLLSIAVDVALLCGLIFSFHIQYAQPPTFYLKAPTVMYLFIFVALRALRFDPRFVLATGLVGILGWSGLVAYAALSEMGAMYITRNYVEYLTSNAILVGAELDKIIVILGVTLLLALTLQRGRQLLVASVRESAAATDLKRFFAPEVARSITGADKALVAGQGEVRDVAVLVVDIRGFTRIAAGLAPGVVMAVLARYQDEVAGLIDRHGGRVDKYLGDGVLATFGAVGPSPTAAADALRTAALLPEAFERLAPELSGLGWPEPLRGGAAVAAGPVTVGVVGSAERLEFTVIGDAVNRAAKFEAANKALGSLVVTDAATHAAAGRQGYDAPARARLAQVAVPGLAAPCDLVLIA